MGDGLDKSPDEGDKSKPAEFKPADSKLTESKPAEVQASEPVSAPEATPPSASADAAPPAVEATKDPSHDDLPIVEAPKLDIAEAAEPAAEPVAEPVADESDFEPSDMDVGASIGPSDVEAMDSTIPEVAAEMPAPAPAPQQRSSRFALLAAVIAVAAASGALIGSLTAAGFMRTTPPEPAPSSVADARAVLQTMKAELAELSALKSNVDVATRSTNTQFARIADRLDRVERAQTEPATKLAHIADAVDRLDKHSTAAPETTGSIKPAEPAAETKNSDRILEGWLVQEVQGGRALVENRNGGIFEVGAGSVLPGIGRVDAVKRMDGQWIVVTDRGLILSR